MLYFIISPLAAGIGQLAEQSAEGVAHMASCIHNANMILYAIKLRDGQAMAQFDKQPLTIGGFPLHAHFTTATGIATTYVQSKKFRPGHRQRCRIPGSAASRPKCRCYGWLDLQRCDRSVQKSAHLEPSIGGLF
jgi:hypothetical protein